MPPRQQHVSRAAIELIKTFEGYRRTAALLDDGRWTIGYGHTKTAREGAEVSPADAEALLIYDLMEITEALQEWLYTPLTQNQFDAVVAFAFNIGLDDFRRSSVLRRLNEGNQLQAACGMELWRRADIEGERIVVDALVRRRAAEKALFLTPPEGFVPTPSSVLKPRVDHDSLGAVPAERPIEVLAPMDGARAVAARGAAHPVEVAEAAPEPEPEARAEPHIADTDAAALFAGFEASLESLADAETAAIPAGEMPADDAGLEPVADPAAASDVLPEPDADAEPEPAEIPLFPEAAGAATRTSADPDPEAPADLPITTRQPEKKRRPKPGAAAPLLTLLGVVGVVLFIAGAMRVFSGGAMTLGGVEITNAFGWGAGVAGIGCVATVVYFVTERLAGREEEA